MECGSRIGGYRTRLVTALLGLTLLLPLTGCGVFAKEFSDGDYAETIPAALRESDLGVTEAFAAKGIDGFTFYLGVGIDIDQTQLSDDALAEMLQIVIDGNDLPTDEMRVTVQNVNGEFVDLDDLVASVAPDIDTGYSDSRLVVTTEQARQIIDAVGREQ